MLKSKAHQHHHYALLIATTSTMQECDNVPSPNRMDQLAQMKLATTGQPGDKTTSPEHAEHRQALLFNISLQHSAFVAHAAALQSSAELWWCVI